MNDAASSCVRFLEYIAEKLEKAAALRPLADDERSRLRLGSREVAVRCRRVWKAVQAGQPLADACGAEGMSVRAFRSWMNRNGLKPASLKREGA